MSIRNRRLNTSSSSSTVRRPSITGNQSKKMGAAKTQFNKTRVALSDITNQGNRFQSGSRVLVTHSKPMVLCASKVAKKKETSTCTQDNGLFRNTLPGPPSLESCGDVSCMDTIQMKDDHPTTKVSGLPSPSSLHTPRSMNISPCRSLCASVSVDETMSTCNSLKSPEFEYVENEEISAV
ncbi:hypothetical protein CRYUN_Cryun30bG0074200 [Craigia yunnanensis]